MGSEALKIKVSNPDVVFFSSLVQLGIASKELRKLGWNGHKLAAYVDDTRLQESQGALEGTMFMTFAMPTEAFSKKYEEKLGRRPEIPAAGGYDAVYAYSKAISVANTFDADKVKAELLRIQFAGASGAIKFDKDGCAMKEPQLWKVENNSLALKK